RRAGPAHRRRTHRQPGPDAVGRDHGAVRLAARARHRGHRRQSRPAPGQADAQAGAGARPRPPGGRHRARGAGRMSGATGNFKAWLDHHGYSLVSALGRFAQRPGSTLLTIGVMAVALALPLGLWLVLDNVGRFAGTARQSRQATLFLEVDVDAGRAAAMADALRAREDVAEVELRTPEQGLSELREQGGLDAAIDALDSNPLPSVLLVTPAGDGALLADDLRDAEGVELLQHDAEWRRRLDGWLRFGGRVALVLALLLGLGAL